MTYPDFFDQVEPLLLYDPLADFLGALDGGVTQITYLDLVKLAGHSCPTVAGIYLMARIGLERLFPDAMPIRGEIEVHIQGAKGEGVNGVIGTGLAYICGVSDEGGFKGIGGRFNRANKLFYQAPISGEVRLKRCDSGASIDLSYDPSVIPPNPEMKELLAKLQSGHATIDDRRAFQKLWQERVAKILLSKELWPQMVTIL
ncbi:MAG: hypothetical protein C6I00_05395 [Nitratiruptor sp.]|nr:hypothetical protein [Nitratiruptor sp.]NPA83534.1 hypothetical protein [Campylobacterota bacterium]